MKRVIVLVAVFLVLFAAMLPSPASADNWRGGHHRGHVGWFWPGALVGGLVFGAVAIATAPIWALGAVAASVAPPPVAYAPPPAYAAPPAYYAAPPVYSAPPAYSAPAYSAPAYSAPAYSAPAYSAPAYSAPAYSAPANSAPVYSTAPSASYRPSTGYAPAPAPRIQREVVYSSGRYVLRGDGVHQPWQWVWEWAPPSASPQTVASPQTR